MCGIPSKRYGRLDAAAELSDPHAIRVPDLLSNSGASVVAAEKLAAEKRLFSEVNGSRDTRPGRSGPECVAAGLAAELRLSR